MILHELGHNFGLLHAASPTYEYGDRSDPQGYPTATLGGFHAIHVDRLGLLDAHRRIELRGDHAGPLDALATSTTRAPRFAPPTVLRIDAPTASHVLYVAYRGAVNHDATLGVDDRNRVQIHRGEADRAENTVILASLVAGQHFVDDALGLDVAFIGGTTSRADVDVRLLCRHQPMVLGLDLPQVVAITPGGTLTIDATLQNQDGYGCGPRGVRFDGTFGSSGVSVRPSPFSVTIEPGASASLTFEVVIDRTRTEVAGDLRFPASSDAASNAITTRDVYLTVDAMPPTPPRDLTAQVFPVKSNDVRLDWLPSFEDTGAIRYEVFRDGVLVSALEFTDPGRPLQYKESGVPLGVHRYVVYGLDSAGNRSAASNEATVAVRVRRY